MKDWERTGGHWLPPIPYKPIGLIATMIAWHRRNNGLDDRPAALVLAQQQAAEQERVAQRLRARAELEESCRARAAGREAVGGASHRAAQQVAAESAARAASKRLAQAAAEAAAREELVALQRAPYGRGGS